MSSDGKTPPTAPPVSGVEETVAAPESGERAPLAQGSTLPVVETGSYQVDGEFARGGIGRILRARDKRLDRPVALKELLRDGGDAGTRFIREALVTARLQHPSIVPVYEAGRWPGGAPFFAMKLVQGRSLDAVIRKTETLVDRLALLPTVIAIAEAIAYAHSEGIIHRDLKPANVLVGAFGETVVIDWGLAKDLRGGSEPAAAPRDEASPPAGSSSSATIQGSVMGTPAYMPPEQAQGEPVDERADVYALGALLYHALAGAAPYTGKSAHEIVARVISGPPVPLEERAPGVPPDLAAIVDKAMARAPRDRYPTAKELAEDLRRYQTGQLVSVHHYSLSLLARKFVRKHRAAVSVAGVLLAILAAFAVVTVNRIVREKERADAERVVAERERAEAETRRAEAQEARRQAEARRDELILAQARAALATDPTLAAAWLKELDPGARGWGSARILAADASDRGVARHVFRGHEGYASIVEYTPDGTTLASTGYDGTVRLWDLGTGAARIFRETKPIEALAFTADGKRLYTTTLEAVRRWSVATGESQAWPLTDGDGSLVRVVALAPDERHAAAAMLDGSITIYDFVGGARRVLSGHAGEINQVAFSPDARTLASAGEDRTARVWDVSTGAVRVLAGHAAPVTTVGFAPDGRSIYTGSKDRTVRFWDRATGAPRGTVRVDDVPLGVGFAPDGATLVVACVDGTVHLYDAPSLRSPRALRGHTEVVNDVAFSPDGKTLVTAGGDGVLRVWRLGSTDPPVVLRGHGTAVYSVAFAPDGGSLASSAGDGAVRIWERGAAETQVLPGAPDETSKPELSPDGRYAAWTSDDGRVRLVEIATGVSRVLGRASDDATGAQATFSPDSRRVAVASGEKKLTVYDVATGEARDVDCGGDHVVAVAFSPDGTWIAASGYEGQPIRKVEIDHFLAVLIVYELGVPEGRVSGLAFSPDGTRLASYGWSPTIQIWNASTDPRIRLPGEPAPERAGPLTLRGHERNVRAIEFSPDGKSLVSGGEDGTVRLWNLETGASRTLGTHGAQVNHVRHSPDGARIASAGDDKNVRVWDPAGGEAIVLRGHTNAVVWLAFSPEGDRLASASVDSFVRLWDLSTRECRVLAGHEQTIWSAAFSPDGKRVATVGGDGTVRVFSDGLPSAPADLSTWLGRLTSARLGAEGTIATPAP